ncbi:Malic acid transport protein-like protein [Hapsidospora chrysogenum ATCC 11550]|uniref:Malic acid transport protein-like protein n=1 Tax=Hapsidospora chrysogenum (strain ATCC 11550 / CBS 779.69 / DSM 880 / IAM 14645 / JCM 23072 / IMI 49137) TaxID=857340 RepID=A0A086SWX9_HAPC1|nr:Malic acid transport protein-like protein [Hapsidospora chrysogenum ATCC 11550]
MSSAHRSASGRKIGIKDRIACYRWTYFTMTMATGGVANVLFSLSFSNDWLTGIGIFFMMLNICLFLLNCVMISMRFYLRPGSFTRSFTDQYELAVIMINICQYGTDHVGNWLLRTMEIMFFIYAAVCVLASAGIYLVLWSTLSVQLASRLLFPANSSAHNEKCDRVFPVHTMTPTWVFPAYPLLLTGPFASQLIAASQRSSQLGLAINSTAVALTAVTIQGTGCLIAFMISAAFIYRLMTQKLPRDTQRPGVFMSIGPFGFTAGSITQLGNQASAFIPPDFLDSPYTIDVFRIVSVLVGLWLWGLAAWFFLISVGSLWKYVRAGSSMPFQMTWWSFVFPNTALITATGTLGEIFQNRGMHIATSVMAAAIIVVWIAVFLTMLRCLKNKTLLWPKNDT